MRRSVLVLSCLSAAVSSALAQSAGGANTASSAASAPQVLPAVVVTATRTEVQAFDTPASISRIDSDDVHNAHSLVNISEDLSGVPGLVARDRQNYSQDVQISVRGFGARSTFGIRGVRLYVDGIPATLPDGQGQITNVELDSVGRIEVLRGPFSALYGNSSGGVIQVFTEEPAKVPSWEASVSGGSFGALRLGAKASGTSGDFGYVLSASKFQVDGYRDHSAADRKLGNAKLNWRLGEGSKLTLIVNSVSLPMAQDPMGLTRAQYTANPRSVDPSAISFNTRKSVEQTQLGAIYEQRVNAANSFTVTAYSGHRGTEQFQSIPVASQASPLYPGGVIELARDYQGLDTHWTLKANPFDAPLSIVGGLSYDALDEHREGYQNFIGSTLGVQGALRRNENNHVHNFDEYLQANWQLTQQWSLNAGLRHSSVQFKSQDHYIVGTNGDDSGSAKYGATLPVLGVMYALNADVHLYASAGKGYETPTLNELAYRPGNLLGLNFGLQAATSKSYEAGIKTRMANLGELTAALYDTTTEHEIVTLTSLAGRSTYQNAGGTRRTGIELGWNRSWMDNLRAQVAATVLNARYTDAFQTCTVAGCSTTSTTYVTVPSGSRMPGLPKNSVFASLGWVPPTGWRGGVEARYLSRVYVNDVNSDSASGYAIASANLGYLLSTAQWDFSAFARVDNLFDRSYVGSVIVNDTNSRYFEPSPGRTWLLSTSATWHF